MDVNDPVRFRIKDGGAGEPIRLERQPRLVPELQRVAASVCRKGDAKERGGVN